MGFFASTSSRVFARATQAVHGLSCLLGFRRKMPIKFNTIKTLDLVTLLSLQLLFSC